MELSLNASPGAFIYFLSRPHSSYPLNVSRQLYFDSGLMQRVRYEPVT